MEWEKLTNREKDLVNFKRRRIARRLVNYAVRQGKIIKPVNCKICKQESKFIQAHHVDYGKPLEVLWLCTDCHKQVHRKSHTLNPRNFPQTPICYNCTDEMVPVMVLVPIETFLNMEKESKTKRISISKVARNELMKKYSPKPLQMEFNLEGKDDNPQTQRQSRVPILVKNQDGMQQQKPRHVQKLRSKRDFSLWRMEKEFFHVLQGHGADASRMQRAGSDR